MAEIKDKVVTVESLSALHKHNENTYMTMVSPVCSGSFSQNRKVDTNVGLHSHAEGIHCTASGWFSHAEGRETISNGNSQHSQGRFNIVDNDDRYAHIVGNGDSSTSPSNAHTLDWEGNGWFAGDVYIGGTSQDDATKLVKSTNVISIEYGDTLPEAGNVGRVFFKKLSE